MSWYVWCSSAMRSFTRFLRDLPTRNTLRTVLPLTTFGLKQDFLCIRLSAKLFDFDNTNTKKYTSSWLSWLRPNKVGSCNIWKLRLPPIFADCLNGKYNGVELSVLDGLVRLWSCISRKSAVRPFDGFVNVLVAARGLGTGLVCVRSFGWMSQEYYTLSQILKRQIQTGRILRS